MGEYAIYLARANSEIEGHSVTDNVPVFSHDWWRIVNTTRAQFDGVPMLPRRDSQW